MTSDIQPGVFVYLPDVFRIKICHQCHHCSQREPQSLYCNVSSCFLAPGIYFISSVLIIIAFSAKRIRLQNARALFISGSQNTRLFFKQKLIPAIGTFLPSRGFYREIDAGVLVPEAHLRSRAVQGQLCPAYFK